ncbi:MAG: hypothetical protein WKG00_16265 [Polyangiaceae bacterium]
MTRLLALAPLLLVACNMTDGAVVRGVAPADAEPASVASSAGSVTAPPPGGGDTRDTSRTIVISSGAQASLGRIRIAAGNIWEDEYAAPGEAPRKGLTAQLWIHVEGEQRTHRRVHPGAVFDAGGRSFTVASVDPAAVRLRTPGEAQ